MALPLCDMGIKIDRSLSWLSVNTMSEDNVAWFDTRAVYMSPSDPWPRETITCY